MLDFTWIFDGVCGAGCLILRSRSQCGYIGAQGERGRAGGERDDATGCGDEDTARGAHWAAFASQGHDSPFEYAGIGVEAEDSEGVQGGDSRAGGEHGGETQQRLRVLPAPGDGLGSEASAAWHHRQARGFPQRGRAYATPPDATQWVATARP